MMMIMMMILMAEEETGHSLSQLRNNTLDECGVRNLDKYTITMLNVQLHGRDCVEMAMSQRSLVRRLSHPHNFRVQRIVI